MEWSRPPESRGWGSRVLGFTDLEISADSLIVRHVGTQAEAVYAFERKRGGEVKVLG